MQMKIGFENKKDDRCSEIILNGKPTTVTLKKISEFSN